MILVFGKTGQVARELSSFEKMRCVGREEVDLTDIANCRAFIEKGNWTAVINAAAYTAVDKAEEEEGLATIINGDAPSVMAEACAMKKIPFVHISTDYVFEGGGIKPWDTDDPVNPQNAYGRSKRAGEEGVIAADGVYAILRTSWVFSQHGQNFVKTMLRLGAERDELSIVADQIGGPTPANAIALACYKIAHSLQKHPEKKGIYHFSGAPDVSWVEFASTIFSEAGIECHLRGIATSEYPTPAKRPLNSRLNCEKIFKEFDIKRPDWRKELIQILAL